MRKDTKITSNLRQFRPVCSIRTSSGNFISLTEEEVQTMHIEFETLKLKHNKIPSWIRKWYTK